MTQRTVSFTIRDIADLAIEQALGRLGITGAYACAVDVVVGPDGEWGFDIIVEDGHPPVIPAGSKITFAAEQEAEAL